MKDVFYGITLLMWLVCIVVLRLLQGILTKFLQIMISLGVGQLMPIGPYYSRIVWTPAIWWIWASQDQGLLGLIVGELEASSKKDWIDFS